MKYFEDFPLGHVTLSPGSYVLTEEEIVEMGRRWDPQPFHVDPVAAEESIFGGLVASTVHLFALGVSIGMNVPEDDQVAAVSALGIDNMRVHAPARPGDEIRNRSRVLEARPSESRPGVGVLRQVTELFNQRDEVVFSYETAWLLQRRP